MMVARAACALLLLPLLAAGCTTGESVNPNLLTPKLVLDAHPSGEGLTLYVHSAIGERRYDRITVELDNETTFVRERAFSLEETIPASRFFVRVEAHLGDSVFLLQSSFDLNATEREDRVEASFLDPTQDTWSEPRAYTLPFERLLDRTEVVRE